MTDDLYQLLECTPSATVQELRANFRRLARIHHPDLNPNDPEAAERFRLTTRAFGILSDETQRAQYDQQGAAMFRPEMVARRRVRGADLRLPLTLSFIEAVNGSGRLVQVPIGEREMRKVEVRVPPGVHSEHVLRVEGGGEPGHPPGDLLLDVAVAPHPVFRRDGRDVTLDLPVSLTELMLGAELSLQTPKGKVPFTIPAQTVPDTLFTIRGHGVAASRAQPAGDLRVTVRLKLPRASKDSVALRRTLEAFDQLYAEPVRDGWFQTSVSSSTSEPSSSSSDPFREESTFSGVP